MLLGNNYFDDEIRFIIYRALAKKNVIISFL